MITITIYNKKGGIGKTTTVQNLAVSLAGRGYKVGVFDFDAQAHQNKCYQFKENDKAKDLQTALLDQEKLKLEDFYETNTPNLWVMRHDKKVNSSTFSHFEFGDAPFAFQKIVTPLFDFVIIDCPPSLDAPAINALVATDFVLSPMEYSSFGMDSLSQLITNLEAAKRYNPKLIHLGIFGSRVESNTTLAELSKASLESNLQELILDCDITKNSDFAKAQAHKMDIYKYGGKKGMEQFDKLTTLVLNKIKTILTAKK